MREDEADKFYFLEKGRESAQQERVDSKANIIASGVRIAEHKLRNIDHCVIPPREEIFTFQ